MLECTYVYLHARFVCLHLSVCVVRGSVFIAQLDAQSMSDDLVRTCFSRKKHSNNLSVCLSVCLSVFLSGCLSFQVKCMFLSIYISHAC
jgi:hypothetical protein